MGTYKGVSFLKL